MLSFKDTYHLLGKNAKFLTDLCPVLFLLHFLRTYCGFAEILENCRYMR